jgi:hypothetical protein
VAGRIAEVKPFFKRFITAIRDENERLRWEEDLVDKINEMYTHISPEGGILTVLTNKTGAASIKGTLVQASAANDKSFVAADTNGFTSMGAVYDDGIADGKPCRVVICGVADVLLQDGTASAAGDWVRVSASAAGRATAHTGVPSPPTADTHFKEIGHCIQTVSSGTNVLTKIIMHFN